MSVWWCAIDRGCTSYDELKHRRIVAQGWPWFGDLSNLSRFVPNHRPQFITSVQVLGDVWYAGTSLWRTKDREPHRAPAVLWNLLSLRTGDLVVGIEGATVRGICELPADGVQIYRYAPQWEYGQTLFDVEWLDWDPRRLGSPPTAPRQGVHGIKTMQQASATVTSAWANR